MARSRGSTLRAGSLCPNDCLPATITHFKSWETAKRLTEVRSETDNHRDRGADQVRAGHQSEDSDGAWPDDSSIAVDQIIEQFLGLTIPQGFLARAEEVTR